MNATVDATTRNDYIARTLLADAVHAAARDGIPALRTLLESASDEAHARAMMGRIGLGNLRILADEMHVSDAETLYRGALVKGILQAL